MSSLQPAISSQSLTARANASTSSIHVSSTANNRGTLTYSWQRSGKTSTINAITSAATTIKGLHADDGSTTIYCDITDSVTGVTTRSPESVITWTALVNQNIVISGTVIYNGASQAYILTGSPSTPAPSGTPSTFIDAGTYVYPTNITSITTDSDYTLGTVSGSFVISPATLTASTTTGSATYTGLSQAVTVLSGTNGTFSGSTSVSGINAGSYTTIITGTGNYGGSVTGTLTIGKALLTLTTSNKSMTYGSSVPVFTHTPSGFVNSETAAVITGAASYSTTATSSSNIGSYPITTNFGTLSATNYSFAAVNGTLTINAAPLTATTTTGSANYNGLSQTVTVLSGINGTFTGSTTLSRTNAGSYTTTITGTGNYTGSVTGRLTLYAGILAASNKTGSATYNGSSQTVTVLSGINGTFSGSASVSGLNTGSYSTTITGTGNYVGSVTGTLTIGKATLTITSSDTSMTYGSSLPTFGFNPPGFLGSDNASVINGTVTHTTTGSSTANVGSYTITPNVSGLSATNYTFSASNGTLTINPATISVTVANPILTYNGALQSGTVITGVLPSGATFTGSFSASGTSAGTYTSSITGSGNYQGTVNGGTLTISPATLTATITTGSANYNGLSQTVTVLSGINGTFTGSTTLSRTNAGFYTTTITGTGNYTGSVTGSLTLYAGILAASNKTGSTTYNGSSQTVTVLSGINGTFSGSASVSGLNAGSYSTTITGTENYVGSVTGTLTISPAPASSSPAYGTTIYQVYDGSTKSATVISGLSGLSYSGSPIASGVNAGTYPTTITLGGNYSGNVTGYLVISQAFGDISLYFGGYVAAGDTNTKVFDSYLQRANASYTWSHSVSGPGARDAYVQPGYGVESTSFATSGFVVTITATISDPNYGASSATTSITFEAYVPPPDGGGGFVSE